MGAPAILAATSGVIKATGAVVSGFSDAQALDAQKKEYDYNATQSRYAATQAYQEGAMAVNMATDSARKEIATGVASMSAGGNIGTSAQAALMQGYFNLSKDVSAINYKYGNEAIQHLNRAEILEYNADIAEKNRKNRILSSWISAGGEALGAAVNVARFAGSGVGSYSGAVTNDGMYGAWGGY